tara:strand:+ start:479 stop:1354 length:876 start_codon:yes stop_codon:yes gene_type:complete
MFKFEGRTALITGGAGGIGFSVAKALGEQKMNIVLTDIDQKNLLQSAAELDALGIPVLAAPLDTANEMQWQAVAQQAKDKFGKVHMVVNNAGVGGDSGPIESQETEGWQWALGVNLMGVVYGAKTIVPLIKEHGEGGWILNVASMAGLGGVPYSGAYTATKAAVVALSEGWAKELKNQSIGVSVLCPAFVKTRIYDSERNRPDKYKSDAYDTSNESGFLKQTKQFVRDGIDASIVGKRVVEAIGAGELYIFTHPNYRKLNQARLAAIDEAFARSEKSPLLKDILNQKPEGL